MKKLWLKIKEQLFMYKSWNRVYEELIRSSNDISFSLSKKVDIDINNYLNIKQLTTLGQVINNTSGIKINNYLRIFGNGSHDEWENIIKFNLKFRDYIDKNKVLIANDIFGGVFGINAESINAEYSSIWYFAPDLLEWSDLEINFYEFIEFVASDNVNEFYEDFKWKGFEYEIKNIKSDEAISIYPFLWSEECNIETADKKIVPFSELFMLNLEFMKKFNSLN